MCNSFANTRVLMGLTAIALCGAVSTYAHPDTTGPFPDVTLHGSVRYRTEIDGRFFDLNAKPLFVNLLKTKIGATIRLHDDVNIVATLQDSRNFGEGRAVAARGTLDGSAQVIGLREGYGQWKNLVVNGLDLKFGRMLFGATNERIVGPLEWHNVGRSFDGITIGYSFAQNFSARGFAFRLTSEDLLMTTATKQDPNLLRGIEVNLPWQDKLNAYLYNDNNGRTVATGPDAGSSSLQRFTSGLYLKNTVGALTYEIEAAYQSGRSMKTDSTARATISAELLCANISLAVTRDLSIGAGLDFYSGNDVTTPNNEAFEHLFITIHKFYGYMDMFPWTVLPSSGQRSSIAGTQSGLIMPYVISTLTPSKDLRLQLWAMMLRTQRDIVGATSRDIGYEVDANVFYTFTKNVSVEGGISLLLPGKALEQTNPANGMGSDPAYWTYMMVTMSF